MRFQSQAHRARRHNRGSHPKKGGGLTKAPGFFYHRSVTEHVSATYMPNVEVREMEKGLRVRIVGKTIVLTAIPGGPCRYMPLPARGYTMT